MGSIEELSVLKLFSAERVAVTNEQLAVAVRAMNEWITLKKKGRGGRRAEADMIKAQKEQEKEKEKQKALEAKEKEKEAKKDAAEKKKAAPAASAAGKSDEEEEEEKEDLSDTLGKARWVRANITSTH